MKGLRVALLGLLVVAVSLNPSPSAALEVFTTIQNWKVVVNDGGCAAGTQQRGLLNLFLFAKDDLMMSSDTTSLPNDRSLIGKPAIFRASERGKALVAKVVDIKEGRVTVLFDGSFGFLSSLLFEDSDWGFVEVTGKRYGVYIGEVQNALDVVKQCNKFHGFD